MVKATGRPVIFLSRCQILRFCHMLTLTENFRYCSQFSADLLERLLVLTVKAVACRVLQAGAWKADEAELLPVS